MGRRGALVTLVLAGVAARGVIDPIAASPQAPQQFRAGVEVVEVTVTVTDERGRPVTSLTRDDFTILEENRAQTITVFGKVDIAVPSPAAVRPDPLRVSTDERPVATNDVAPDGRVFALVLDDQLTQPYRTLAVRRLARQFVDQHVGPRDLVGVFSTGGLGKLTQEFTTDRRRVLDTIGRFHGSRIRSGETDPERVHDIQNAMDTIAELAGHLSGIRGRRIAVLWVSEGIDYNVYQALVPSSTAPSDGPPATLANLRGTASAGAGVNESRDPQPTPVVRAVQQAVDALTRANVVLYGIDPRGLYSQEGEWLEFNPQDKTGPPPPDPQELVRSIQSLRSMSERTGGFALVNTNDFGADFARIVEESSHYYVLGYSPSRRGQPGEYRRIAVRVRPGLRVSAREGYVVPAPRPAAPAPRPVLAALDDSLPQPHLPLRVQAIPLPARDSASLVRLVQLIVEIDGAGLAFREAPGQFSDRLELAVKTVDDLAVEGHRSATEMNLPPLSAQQRERLERAGIRWLTTIEAAPGHYSLRVAAHSTAAGRTGSVFVDLDVPPFDPGSVRLGDLAVTSTSAGEAPTAGTSSILPPLPGPATTRRVFRTDEIITIAATIEASALPVVTTTLRRLDAEAGVMPVTGTIPVMKAESGMAYILFSLPPEARQPGRFAIAVSAQRPDGAQHAREVTLEVVPVTGRQSPP